METLPLPVKGCEYWPMIGTHGHWEVRSFPFIMVISEDLWRSHLWPSEKQWSYKYLFLRLRFVAAGIRTPNISLAGPTSVNKPLFAMYVSAWLHLEKTHHLWSARRLSILKGNISFHTFKKCLPTKPQNNVKTCGWNNGMYFFQSTCIYQVCFYRCSWKINWESHTFKEIYRNIMRRLLN